ncbi:MAG: family 16 glycosylhydrolase [Flavobacteriales bacterium]|nr:family 16 glycosylhydrolase [Flavobacteriales bacterium]MCW8913345.1 family 16 glycosylhydrolase [Flavobacteriales bacterium]MCW8936921.1 family 16 glycosylhydrolase [Flavobacteriales bacterium]MCW8939334.1 family 16 glycosylhydrolase [Flavobacteriales bacterium]MCW8968618.1 family 16 glycosylhydrolase [Flavobacteriales bacterium]
MIKIKIILLVLTLIIVNTLLNAQTNCNNCNGCCSGCQEKITPFVENKTCNYNPWILAFEDNFDGNQIDLSKWDVKESVIRGFSNPTAWMSPNNVEVSNGTLKLIATQNTPPLQGTYIDWSANPPTTQTGSFNYSVGEIWTDSLFGYGKYEIRAKIPFGKGFYPAFWTFGGVGWNEIDVFEINTDAASDYNMNIHYYPNTQSLGSYSCQDDWKGPNLSVAFHTYTMEWDFFKIRWYVDGIVVRTIYRFLAHGEIPIDCSSGTYAGLYSELKAFPIEDMHIILSQQIATGSHAPNFSTIFPAIFEIDYVRYWRKEPIPNPCNNVIVKWFPFTGSYLGEWGLLNQYATVMAGTSADIIVRDKLYIQPNFKAQHGSYFHAKADPVACGTSARMANEEGDSTSTYERPPNLEKEDEEETIASSNQNSKLLIFPNPTNGLINIELNSNKPYFEIEVFSLLGELVYANKVNGSKLSFDLSPYPKGMYLVKIKQDNHYYHEKISYY